MSTKQLRREIDSFLGRGIDLQMFANLPGGDPNGDPNAGGDPQDPNGGGDPQDPNGGGDPDGGDPQDPPERTIPYSRFQKVNSEKKAYADKVAGLETELAQKNELLKGKETADASLKSDNDSLRAELNSERLRNSFIAESLRQGINFNDVNDAIRLADFSQVGLENGRVNGDDMKFLVEEFIKSKPYLVKASDQKSPSFPNGNPGNGKPPVGKTPVELAQERAKARFEKKNNATNDPWKRG